MNKNNNNRQEAVTANRILIKVPCQGSEMIKDYLHRGTTKFVIKLPTKSGIAGEQLVLKEYDSLLEEN